MKRTKIYTLIIGLLVFSSCQEWLDINNDPSYPQIVTAEVVLPVMFAEMVRGEAFDSRFFGCYVQNWARTTASQEEDRHGYYSASDNMGEKWRQHYFAVGKNIDLIIEDATPKGKWWYVGVAYAIRAWSWQTSTDVYGEMILEQAWEDGRYVFDYDTQEEVYAEVVRLCNLALENLNKEDNTNSLGVSDLVYAGDINKWKKFVYAILARNAHHLSNKAAYDPDAVIGFVDQALAANTDNFNVPHLGTTSTNANFWGPTRGNLSAAVFAYRQSIFSINHLNGTTYTGVTDPRLPAMFQPSTDGVYRGAVNGTAVTLTGATGIPTLYNKYIYRDNAPLPIFTYAEMQFIKAEAAFVKGDLPTALTAYTNGINAHFDYVASLITVPADLTTFNTNRPTYMASTAVAQNTGELTLSRIMVQKYIAMYGHGILETWVDMRRHHYSTAVYPGLAFPPLSGSNNGNLAYRTRPRYNSEYVWNVKALGAIGALATDYHTKELWFSTPD